MTPGYYRTNLSAVSLRECYRLTGLWSLPLVYAFKRFLRPKDLDWMPALHRELLATERELSAETQAALTPWRDQFLALGYRRHFHQKIARTLNAQFRDGGGFVALAPDGRTTGLVTYVRTQPPQGPEVRKTVFALVGYLGEGRTFTFGSDPTFLDPIPGSFTRALKLRSVPEMLRHFEADTTRRGLSFIVLRDLGELADAMDTYARITFEHRAQVRRLYLPATPEDIAAAEAAMPAGTPPRVE